MVEMGRFAKNILAMTPPDPFSMRLRDLGALAGSRAPVPRPARARSPQPDPAAHDERDRLPRSVVRDRRAESHDVGVGDHRHVPRRAVARHRLCAAPPLHGRHRRRLPVVGTVERRHRTRVGSDRRAPRAPPAPRSGSSAPVRHILVSGGEATGVVLENGDYHMASAILSSVDPRQTFMRMVGVDQLPAEFADDIRRYKFRGSSGKVNFALDGLPDFTARPGPGPHLRGAISISPSIDYMERAYDEAKYGRYSRRPYIDIVIPSLTDPSVAPPGKHVMSCFVQYAPYDLEGTGGRRQPVQLGRPSRRVRRRRRQRDLGARAELPRPHPAPAGARRRSISSVSSGCRKETSSRASLRSSSCSFSVRFPAGPTTGRRSAGCSCAGRPRTPAAASWARRAGTPRCGY